MDLPDDSLELAHRAQKGDQEALNELFQRYEGPLRRIIRVRMGAHLRREGGLESLDIIQQTWMKAYSKLEHIEIRSAQALLSWLARIAERQVHDALDHMRAAKRDVRRTGPLMIVDECTDSVFGYEPTATDTLPGERAERDELKEAIDTAMLELKDEYREVILLRDYEKREWESITEEIGAPTVRAAQATHYRAKMKLASLLGNRLEEFES